MSSQRKQRGENRNSLGTAGERAAAEENSDEQCAPWNSPIEPHVLFDLPCYAKSLLLSDDELISAAQEGAHFALGELLSRHRSTVYRAASRFFGCTQEAEDVVQETMLRAVKHFRSFRKDSRFSTWLVAIAINTATSIKRKENRVRWIYLDEPVEDNELPRERYLSDNRQDPERKYLDHERHNIMRRALSEQHPQFQVILQWCDLDEVSLGQAASRLGITYGAAKSRLFRARRMLRGTIRGRIGESR